MKRLLLLLLDQGQAANNGDNNLNSHNFESGSDRGRGRGLGEGNKQEKKRPQTIREFVDCVEIPLTAAQMKTLCAEYYHSEAYLSTVCAYYVEPGVSHMIWESSSSSSAPEFDDGWGNGSFRSRGATKRMVKAIFSSSSSSRRKTIREPTTTTATTTATNAITAATTSLRRRGRPPKAMKDPAVLVESTHQKNTRHKRKHEDGSDEANAAARTRRRLMTTQASNLNNSESLSHGHSFNHQSDNGSSMSTMDELPWSPCESMAVYGAVEYLLLQGQWDMVRTFLNLQGRRSNASIQREYERLNLLRTTTIDQEETVQRQQGSDATALVLSDIQRGSLSSSSLSSILAMTTTRDGNRVRDKKTGSLEDNSGLFSPVPSLNDAAGAEAGAESELDRLCRLLSSYEENDELDEVTASLQSKSTSTCATSACEDENRELVQGLHKEEEV